MTAQTLDRVLTCYRIGDPHGTPAVTVDISDYRKVGPVLIGFHGVIRGGDGAKMEELNVGTTEFVTVDRSRFDPRVVQAAYAVVAMGSTPLSRR